MGSAVFGEYEEVLWWSLSASRISSLSPETLNFCNISQDTKDIYFALAPVVHYQKGNVYRNGNNSQSFFMHLCLLFNLEFPLKIR